MKKITINGETLKVRMSHSFMNNAACPLYLKYHYVDKEPTKFVRIPALRGSALHAAIEDILRICIEEQTPPCEVSNTGLRNALLKHMPPEILSESKDLLSWLRLWADNFRLPKYTIGLEEKIGLDEDYERCDFSEASYRGVIDLLQSANGHAIITDWKSQANILSKEEMANNEQLTFYCWLVSKIYPEIERFTARIWYLRNGFYSETHRTEADLDEFEEVLILKERKISELKGWDPIPGKQCDYCDYIHKCPVGKDLSPENPAVITQEQAILRAAEITKMEAHLKAKKDALKKYVKANDEVRLGDDWVYGFRVKTYEKYDRKALRDVLVDFDLDPAEFMNVDLKKLRKLLKEASKDRPDLEEALLSIQEFDQRTEFKGYKRKAS